MLILAGAGSGKTRVIIHRIAHLVRECGVRPGEILAVTFTNKAAGEMKARVEALLGSEAAPLWLSTFHSLCVRILRRDAEAAGLPRDFVIYDDTDQLAVVRDALRGMELAEKVHPPRRVLAWISARKNRGGFRADPGTGEGEGGHLYEGVAHRYQQALRAAQAVDFDDLLLVALELLRTNAAVREGYRRRFRYILVDEYQDTNRVQYELVRELAGVGGNVTVVGDEDQSIYSWRGAEIRNILDFEGDFPGAQVLRLEHNYRSSQAILDAAGAVVAHNLKRKGKTLVATRGRGEPVVLHEAGDEYQEAAWVVDRIRSGARSGRAAVLFRMNAQSRLFEEALLRAGLDYVVVGGVGFYERKEVKDLLAYLRLILNPDDPVAFKRVLNVPARGIGERTQAELERAAQATGRSLFATLGAFVDERQLPARATQPLLRFRELIEGLRAAAPGLTVKRTAELVLERSGYAAALAQEDSHESQDRLANLAELLSAAADHDARQEAPDLASFLDSVSLLSDVDKTRGEAPVLLMTLHSAKGLEFERVFLVGLEEGLMPHAHGLTTEDGVEEERRLCYVGMTRAMDVLHLTWALTRQVFGQRRLTEASRFLSEIPEGAARPTTRRRKAAAWEAVLRRERPARTLTPPATSAAAAKGGLAPGQRVRHPLFGVGTVVRVEGGGDELKVTVAFPGVGAKRLVVRYAGLEPV